MIVKILKITPVTYDVKSFIVEKPQGYNFIPGQATEVSINKPGWEDKKRPFTFTSTSEDDFLEFIIKSYPKKLYPHHQGVTEEIHKLKVGDQLILDSPFGAISYRGKGVFIAGGAGITPFIAIFRQLAKEGKLEGNKLFFSNKTSKDIILEDELKGLFPKKGDLVLTLTREEKLGYKSGRVDEVLLKKYLSDFSQNFYLCGPLPMVGEISQILIRLGAYPQSLIFEK